MKNKKTVIIIAVVIAVFLWLYFRKNKATAETLNNGSAIEIDLDYVFEHVPFTQKEHRAIEKVYNWAAVNNAYRQKLLAKSYSNGVSYSQQVALDGMWNVYEDEGADYKDRYENLIKLIENL